tara:strand:+ start:97 stop:1527 length:1431 start_codon:yes stop_codon:yes gene_type:complete
MAYPSPYRVGMSALGYQQIYRAILAEPGWTALRAFNDVDEGGVSTRPFVYELGGAMDRPDAIAFSVSYELEIAGVVQMLTRMGLEPLRRDRRPDDPPVVIGGPLTFSNPTPLLPYCDVLICGEGEALIGPVLRVVDEQPKARWDEAFSELEGVVLPGDGSNPEHLPVAKSPHHLLPARSAIVATETELREMFLIEPERGCSRQCTYCVMRRSTNGGMRRLAADHVLSLVPEGVNRVGLVGAAVTDHIELPQILEALVARGVGVGISSLRADRLKPRLLQLLREAGYKSLTIGLDGASPRLRRLIERKSEDLHVERVARDGKAVGFMQMKVYMVLGLPTETDEDIETLAQEMTELSTILPVALGLAILVPKRNTPLYSAPFIGIRESDRRLKRLRRALKGRANLRPVSTRWAWVEAVLARGGVGVGEAVLRAERAGGRFANYRREFESLGYFPDGRVGEDCAPMGTDGGIAYQNPVV